MVKSTLSNSDSVFYRDLLGVLAHKNTKELICSYINSLKIKAVNRIAKEDSDVAIRRLQGEIAAYNMILNMHTDIINILSKAE